MLMALRKDTFEVDSHLYLIGTQPPLCPLCLRTQALDRQLEPGRVNAFETTEFGIYCSDSTLVTSATKRSSLMGCGG